MRLLFSSTVFLVISIQASAAAAATACEDLARLPFPNTRSWRSIITGTACKLGNVSSASTRKGRLMKAAGIAKILEVSSVPTT